MSSRREAWPHPPFHGTQQENFQKNKPTLGFAHFLALVVFQPIKRLSLTFVLKNCHNGNVWLGKTWLTLPLLQVSLQKSCRTTQNAKSTIGQDWVNFHKHSTMSLRSLRSLRSLTVSDALWPALLCSFFTALVLTNLPRRLGSDPIWSMSRSAEPDHRIAGIEGKVHLAANSRVLTVSWPNWYQWNSTNTIKTFTYHIFMHYVYLIYVNREPKGCKRRISRFRLLEVEQRWAYASKKFCTTVAHQRILQTSHFPSYAQE